MKRATVLVAATLAALSFAGCEDNPCQDIVLVGKITMVLDKDDGTVVEVDGQEATCQDGEPVVQ